MRSLDQFSFSWKTVTNVEEIGVPSANRHWRAACPLTTVCADQNVVKFTFFGHPVDLSFNVVIKVRAFQKG